jgi:CheY-like chemotaxis protein
MIIRPRVRQAVEVPQVSVFIPTELCAPCLYILFSFSIMAVSQSQSVWIVDDNEDDQYLFELALQTLNPPVAMKLLTTGEELIVSLRQQAILPSLIVLDVTKSQLNGFDTLKQLRAEPVYQHLPILVLSTSLKPEDQKKARQLGANGFLTEQGSTGDLLMLFNELVNGWTVR